MPSYMDSRTQARTARDCEDERRAMVEQQLMRRGIADERVLQAMASVPRHFFVAEPDYAEAYADRPLGIGEAQTISQPFIVALSAEAAEIQPEHRVLEIGTGSGYSAAVLACLCRTVYTVERHPSLARGAQQALSTLGYDGVQVRCGDGTLGWPEYAPFDAIIVTATGPEVPNALLNQLKPGGRLVMPVGVTSHSQDLQRVLRTPEGNFESESLLPVRFVPLIGQEGWPEATQPG